MSAPATLTADLRAQVLALAEDLRNRVEPEVGSTVAPAEGALERWREEYARAVAADRSAATWTAWRDERVTQAAVAWVLATVFIRFCEDNALVAPVWIGGPAPRRQEALDAQREYFRTHPTHTDREYLGTALAHLRRLPATRDLFDRHSPTQLVSPSGDAAAALLAFWRERDETGALLRDLTDPELSTRFLGDLYQDVSQSARETYALLQTPEFVEEFILDRTLEPALAERPLDGFALIDPACGSGHFLLGAFARLLDRWNRAAPGMQTWDRIQHALDAIHGVDVNPFAVAIARFRLTLAALRAGGVTSLDAAPAFGYHLAAGDSLWFGALQESLEHLSDSQDDAAGIGGFAYRFEDRQTLRNLLQPGRYDVVVGNPPYITVKDKALNEFYRGNYETCKGTYAMTVPFMELFFRLARRATDARPAGWVGQITSNSFMKREFGAPLIEKFLPRVDLRNIIDSEGAWIPGHNTDGTPTVIIVGRNRNPVGPTVRCVLSLGKREARDCADGSGPYWTSIVEHFDEPGHEDGWTSTADLDRTLLAKHPWSLTGGGAVGLLAEIERVRGRLADRIGGQIGRSIRAGADEAFMRDGRARTSGVANDLRALVLGEDVRDWHCDPEFLIWYPYTYGTGDPVDLGISRELWSYKTVLAARRTFQGNMADAGMAWWEYMQHTPSAYVPPLSIAFAFVATHNHFVLDRGGKVFKQSAPVIKLPEGATEDDHLSLLGVLNSSTACFWLKQQSQPKGGAAEHLWSRTYEFTGTTLQDFPLPETFPRERARHLDALAVDLAADTPEAVCATAVPTRAALDAAHRRHDEIRGEMIAQQEELDWDVYRRYGLLPDAADGTADLTYPGDDLPRLNLGERTFEIALARRVAAGQEQTAWFERHRSTPITEIPAHWPAAYRDLVQRRLDLIAGQSATSRNIALLEKPEYKRRWASEPWGKQQERALRSFMLDRLEDSRFWFDRQGRPAPRSVGQLADDVARDPDLTGVLALWEGRPDIPVTASLTRLLADQAVPFLAAYRYRDSGLRKRADWERTWALQRREDAGEKLAGTPAPIPVPPKYTSADFVKPAYWHARGKLDVPKERFIAYPNAGRATDPTPLLGWAGWDHAQQALALNTIIAAREQEGWTDEQLVPLTAGLSELQPWVEQWHAGIDPTYGVSLADFCREQLTARRQSAGLTLDELAAWRPAQPSARRGRRPNNAAK